MKIISVVGARPNFMKVAPVHQAFADVSGVESIILHTGQHYDRKMSEVFFQELGLPQPDVNLDVGSGSHAAQTAAIMTRFESYVVEAAPDLVLVYGDVNSTVACALVCAKLHIPVGHVEAGLRSFDRSMPEEINRLVTDQIADLLFTPSPDGDENLLREGVSAARIHRVGNVMIDTLIRLLPKAEAAWPALASRMHLRGSAYGLVTLHRPSNVDEPHMLTSIFSVIEEIAKDAPVVFPVHPRTQNRLEELGLQFRNVQTVEPLGYLDFLALQQRARFVITDSGGVQEETTYLGIPCLTLRENTERPVTVTEGTNVLIGRDLERLTSEVDSILLGREASSSIPDLWDGQAGVRIAETVVKELVAMA